MTENLLKPLALLLLCVQVCPQKPSFCPSWSFYLQAKCPLVQNATAELDAVWEAEFAGQELATRTIRKVLSKAFREYDNAVVDLGVTKLITTFPYTFDIMNGNPISQHKVKGTESGRPIFMHFAGSQGVGKSYCTELIARAMFAGVNAENKRCGHLQFEMSNYESTPPKNFAKVQNSMYDAITQQLHSCPRSLIVFDEVQKVDEKMLDAILDMFYGKHAIEAGQAVLIMVSDLGVENCQLHPQMTREEVTQPIQDAVATRFLRVKQLLLDNIVPFVPLAADELEKVTKLKLLKLQSSLLKKYRNVWAGRLTWQKEV
eukprot:CAMPEP_0181301298 /NCGR_PEP_ID=MMETSP1101-20121128/7346_1 /TAXON_ID=46948 /ORGANISM="Rhodomonas abbreviata, Strain Caron Lab Isolate" /LENGTH=315 /DNA_ID=CAMNT_0023406587 /DNA_START=12 /DNA_END=955 /DNA_ORIENTATION=+